LKVFQRLNEEKGITIILVTHDAEVARHTRRVIRMKDGIIDTVGPQHVPRDDAGEIDEPNLVASN
jgi:ABC-type lipoprotein export system ATPase subunit